MFRRLLAVALVLSLCVSPLLVGAAETPPRFEAHVADQTLTPGAEQTVTVALVNDAEDAGDTARTAEGVLVRARVGKTPLDVRAGTHLLGAVADGESRTVDVGVVVPVDADPGTYHLPLTVVYDDGDRRETETVRATVRVPERPRLRVVETDAAVTAGETGTAAVTVENAGTAPARAARLTLASGDAAVQVGAAGAATRLLGTLAPGDRRTVNYTLRAGPDVEAQRYALGASATFEDRDGIATSVDLGAVGVTPTPAATFAVDPARSTLRVGREGTLRATVVNRGPGVAHNAVVVLETPAAGVRLLEPVYPVGDVGPGASATVAVPVAVPRGASAGPRAFTATVRYETADGTTQTGEARTFRRRVAPETTPLRFEATNASFEVDSDNRLVVRVTNVGNESLTDVRAHLAAGPPFTSAAPQSYVRRLDPGESARLSFALTVSEDAVAGTYAVGLNATADADTETVQTGGQQVPVRVTEPQGTSSDLVALGAGAVLVAVVLVAGWWWLRR